jgi:UDP-N-acetylmuramyl pentapeptide phosphotransferase/UDP-N-acetylglucosamine-1-phosphate transferase
MLLILFLSAFVSLIFAVLLVRFKRLHARFSIDSDLDGVQKFHSMPVPRIGGVAIFAGLLAGVLLSFLSQANSLGLALLAIALPAFFSGLLEDLTKKVGAAARLLATFVSAVLGFALLHAAVARVGVAWVDGLLSHYLVFSLVFTMVAVGGVAHSINIIDGYNGLSGMVSLIIFLALAYVSFKTGDSVLMAVSLAACGAVAGFLLLNYPLGLIFSGDGGAYLQGFMIAEIAVLLVARNPDVSPWCPLLLVIYPVFETLFSIYRRKVLQGRSVGHPDALHLHSVIYRRLVRWMVGSKESKHLTRRNSMTAPYLWTLATLSVVPAVLFWRHTYVLMLCVVLFIGLYIYLYRMIVHFKAPRWMVVRKKTSRTQR